MRVGIDGRSLVNEASRGIARYARELVSALADAYPEDDWRVLVAAGEPSPPIKGIHLTRVPMPSRVLYGASGIVGYPRLDRLLGGVDVFWAPAPAPLAISPNVPFVLSLHDLSWEFRPADFTNYERLWHRIARPRTLAARARRVMVDCDQTGEEAVERWGLSPEQFVTVPVGVRAPDQPLNAQANDAVRRRHGLPPRYFLWVGALEPRKAPDLLGRAFVRARASGLDAELAVIGEGRLRSALALPAVHMLGRVTDSDLDHLYAGALALVMPSRLEGWGLPPLEAALRGTPSIVSDLAVFRSTLGEGARRVAVDDEQALASALIELAADETGRKRLSTEAADMARRFTPDRSATAVHAILSQAGDER